MNAHDLEDNVAGLVRPFRAGRLLAYLVIGMFVATVLVLWLVPWVQTVHGEGRVIAYGQSDRQQNIEAPIEGRVVAWYVKEGARVKKGDLLVELSDNDPAILQRLAEERAAVASRLEAIRARVASTEQRISQLERSRTSALGSADGRVKMARQRAVAAAHALEAARSAERTAELNHDRQSALLQKGLTSARSVELAELERVRTRTEADRAAAALAAAQSEAAALETDRQKAGSDGAAGIDDARAGRATALAEEAATSAELARVEVRLARQSAQRVTAPRDGYVLRVASGEQGNLFKAGDLLLVLVPDTQDRAVELWVSGRDVPLVSENRHVRLQFEGWPALQFSGWPSAAVGTFGGRVAVIDASDDGHGRFRVIIVPDGEWPKAQTLRQGARARGWVVLNQVSLGFEMWRQLNGFPPAVNAPKGDKS